MTIARHLVAILALTLFFPPLGLIVLGLYVLGLLARRAQRDGGILTRRKYDAWAKEEPWWTGDEEADQARLNELRRQHYAGGAR